MHTPCCYLLGPAPLPGADAWVLDAGEAAANVAAPGLRWLLRVRPAGTPDFEGDLERARSPGIVALMLPGVRDIGDVCALVEHCVHEVLPVIDNAQGLDHVRAIAQVPGVARLVFDAHALQRQLGIGDDDGLLAYRAQVVLASRLAGLAPPVDHSRLAPERARRLGFGACLCQGAEELAAARAAFQPLPARTS